MAVTIHHHTVATDPAKTVVCPRCDKLFASSISKNEAYTAAREHVKKAHPGEGTFLEQLQEG